MVDMYDLSIYLPNNRGKNALMKVYGFDNREYSLQLKTRSRSNESNGHKLCREIIEEIFPLERVFEEIKLPGSKRTGFDRDLYLDFFIPSKKLAIEVDGLQHDKFNKFHYKDEKEFKRAKTRDERKNDWCMLNGITIVRLSSKESGDEWKKKILNNR